MKMPKQIELKIERVISSLYREIEAKNYPDSINFLSEYDLRKELIGCMLGSQIRYETTVALINNIEFCGLFEDDWWVVDKIELFSFTIYRLLSGKAIGLPYKTSHRFPHRQAVNLIGLHKKLIECSLSKRLMIYKNNPQAFRKHLVEEFSGIGPKQASMFIRNIGASSDLAVLDTHILRFLGMLGVQCTSAMIATISGYERIENAVRNYASLNGYRTGHLDIAIWATMKAAREIGI